MLAELCLFFSMNYGLFPKSWKYRLTRMLIFGVLLGDAGKILGKFHKKIIEIWPCVEFGLFSPTFEPFDLEP